MIGVVLISENNEAREMLKSLKRLLGKQTQGITSVILDSSRTQNQLRAQLKNAIDRVNHKKGVLLLADLYGSTQCNVCMKFIKKGSVELLTGFNMPMLVKLGLLHQELALTKLVPFLENYAKEQIRHINSKKGC